MSPHELELVQGIVSDAQKRLLSNAATDADRIILVQYSLHEELMDRIGTCPALRSSDAPPPVTVVERVKQYAPSMTGGGLVAALLLKVLDVFGGK